MTPSHVVKVDAAFVAGPFVFLDDASRPYLCFRGWLHYRHPDGDWVTLREVTEAERESLAARKLPVSQAALYGWPCVGAAPSTEDTGEI